MRQRLEALPDPGVTVRRGRIAWRAVPGSEAFLEGVERFRFGEAGRLESLELLKEVGHVFWGRLRTPGGDFFLKGYRNVGLGRRLRSLARASPFREEWRKTWWLRLRRIETAEPVAVGEVRRCGVLLECFLAYRWLSGARNLLAYLEEQQGAQSPRAFERLRRRMAGSLGGLFGALHARGAFHRQFHDRNILVTEGPGGAPRLIPIDLDHLTVRERLTEGDRDWNFHQLAWHFRRLLERWPAGPRDVLAFLHGYRAEETEGAPGLRELARRVFRVLPPSVLPRRPRRREFETRRS